jgi:threonine/homoserine/homoserine lactone efflux protein
MAAIVGDMSIGESVLAFLLVAGLVTVTPGLDTALVLRSALTEGRRHAFATALGINSGVLVWAVAAAAGGSVLLTSSSTAYSVIRIAGAGYLVYFGARLLWGAVRGDTPRRDADASTGPSTTLWAAYRSGALTNLLNPKVGAFYIAMLPQFIPDGTSPIAMGLLLAMLHNVQGIAWFAVIILAASRARRALGRPAARRAINGISGSVLVGFGAKLARSQPS